MISRYSRLQAAGAGLLTAAVVFGAFTGFSVLRNLTVQHAGPIAGAIVYLMLIPVVFILVTQYHRRINGLDRYNLGMGVRGLLASTAKGFIAGGGMVLLAILVVLVAIAVHAQDLDLSVGVRLYPAMGFLIVSVVTGAWEELLFRGLVFATLLKLGQRRYYAALLSSALFVLPHIYLGNPQYPGISLIGVFIFGMLLAHVYAYSGQIGWVIGLHAGWNFCVGGLEHLVDNARGATAPIGNTPQMFSELMQVTVVLLVYGVYLYRKKQQRLSTLETNLHG